MTVMEWFVWAFYDSKVVSYCPRRQAGQKGNSLRVLHSYHRQNKPESQHLEGNPNGRARRQQSANGRAVQYANASLLFQSHPFPPR